MPDRQSPLERDARGRGDSGPAAATRRTTRTASGSALDELAVQATRRTLSEARGLPGAAYWSAEIFATEQETIFSDIWVCVGRERDLPIAGDVRTVDIAGESILLVRDAGDRLQAFYNVCRHRGSRLVSGECDRRKKIQCPYHAWTYDLDGRLVGAPLMDSTSGFRNEDHSLVSVALDLWQGFVFISLAEQPPSIGHQLAELPDLDRFGLANLEAVAREIYDVDANWKLLCQNYGECYHCALVHPQLHRISHYLSGGKQEMGASFTGGPMTLNEGCNTMSVSGITDRPSLPGLTDDDLDQVYYYCIYPGFLLSLHRDYVLTHTVTPVTPNRSRIVCEWLFHSETVARTDFDPSDAVEFWDMTNRQDWQICEQVQQGVSSRGYRPGRYQTGEGCVHAFDNWYLDRMGV